jgi:sugar lactone lactonase YvrE
VRTLFSIMLLVSLCCPVVRGTAQSPSRGDLDARLREDPNDAVVLFRLATLEASEGRRDGALRYLDAVSRAPGGLDPSFHRGFWSMHGDARYEEIVKRIRAAQPPLVRSALAFEIPERDLHPEGIAFDPQSRSTFLGSFKGKIVRVDSLGAASDFMTIPPDASARVVVGIRVDPDRRHLWATVDDPTAFGDPTVHGGSIHQYDLASGRLLAVHGPVTGAFNDLVVAPNGDVYATNTTEGNVWVIPSSNRTLRRHTAPGSVPEANGITVDPSGRLLYVGSWHDIQVVSTEDGQVRPISSAIPVVTASFDGLYWYAGGLVGIQNSLHPGRVVRLRLDPRGEKITSAEVIERYHPQFAGMTTAALDGDTLLYIVNTQSRRFLPDGSVRPGERLDPILVVRLPLR